MTKSPEERAKAFRHAPKRLRHRDEYTIVIQKLPERGRGYFFVYEGQVLSKVDEATIQTLREVDTKRNGV